MDDIDVFWNELGYKSGDYVVHVQARMDGMLVDFWGRFSPYGILNGEVKYKFEVDKKPSNNKQLRGRVLEYIKGNWKGDKQVKIEVLGDKKYLIRVGDSETYRVTAKICYDKKAAKLKSFDFKKEDESLMTPFGDIIREMLRKIR